MWSTSGHNSATEISIPSVNLAVQLELLTAVIFKECEMHSEWHQSSPDPRWLLGPSAKAKRPLSLLVAVKNDSLRGAHAVSSARGSALTLPHPLLLQVSFTGLASRSFGPVGGQVVAVVYAALNYSLLVACIAGLGEIVGKVLGLPPAIGCAASTGQRARAPSTVNIIDELVLCTP